MLPGTSGGVDPRQMNMMMRKLGIEVRDVEGVQEVVVRTATKDYVFGKASVSIMKAQGTETWQITGKPRIVEKTAPASPSAPSAAAAEPEPAYEPSGEDVALVARETGKPVSEARRALVEAKGDLAEAILKLGA
jgi:nascent polypeptide-associated complex subunit alpha